MRVKTKLTLLTAGVAVSILFTVGLGLRFVDQMIAFKTKQTLVSDLEIYLINLRRNEKDFIDRLDLTYAEQFNLNVVNFEERLDELNREAKSLSLELPLLDTMHTTIVNYQKKFMSLVTLYQTLGLNSTSGIWGRISEVNDKLMKQFPNDPDIAHLVTVVDLLIVETTQANFEEFLITWDTELFRPNQTNLRQQKALVERYMATKRKVGLSHNKALLEEMRVKTHKLEENFDRLRSQLNKELNRAEHRLKITMVVTLICMFVGFVSFSAWFNRSIQKRLRSLTDVIEKIASERNLTFRVQHEGNDEIDDVSKNLNIMLDDYQMLITEVKELILMLNVAASEMRERSVMVESSLNTQEAEAMMAASSVKSMEARILDIAANTELAASNAEQSLNRAHKGNQTVLNTNQSIVCLSEGLDIANLDVQGLVTLSQEIGSVVDVIKNISEQINLLALNAAIEAARAGEQGRGFAVVADEVRSLAIRTNVSTDEIASMITALQQQISQVVHCISQCKDNGEESVSFVKEAATELDNIIVDMQSIMNMSTQIAEAIEQQSSVAKEVTLNVQSIQEITKDNTLSTSENAKMAAQIFEQCKKLDQTLAVFRSE